MTADNNTADEEGNLTSIIETVEESGMLDALMDDPLLLALAALVLGLGAYIAYTVPAVKELVFKYLKNNEAELMTAWDEKDDELASLVKSKVKSALDEGKTL